MSPATDAPGWHGKLPSLGDFASRRLDGTFVEAWDEWLAGSLLALRQANPEGWLQDYLASPSWRFLLMPGVLPASAGTQAWAGVLVPSVDRVGRYFPFTVAQALGEGPVSSQQMDALWHWLGRLDELARDALFDDWTVDQLEQELARMAGHGLGFPPQAPEWMVDGDGLAQVAVGDHLDAAVCIGIESQRLWASQAQGRAWWHARPDDAPARLLVSRGLPPVQAVARLLGHAATI